ncbi:MAG: RNA polymerase subunit sigma [Lachnospiraceae bacterium]|nr:RNA polymerase subunit sigma [Lachnospiraceae bacterium]
MSESEAAELSLAKTDPEARDRFLLQNKKFILQSAYYALNRYITDSDEEWSVALLAFNEAIDAWAEDKGSSFQSFAQLVIKRRLLNYLRSETRYRRELTTDPAVLEGDLTREEEPTSFEKEVHGRIAALSGEERRQSLSDEIDALEETLAWYPIDFFDLENVSPKAGKTRDACGVLIARLWRNKELYKKMRESKSLPVKDLLSGTGIHKKIPERHRKFIIASAEILCGDYPILQEYLSYVKEL